MKIKKIAVLVGMGVAFSGGAQATNYYYGDVTNTSVSTSDAHLLSDLSGSEYGQGFFYKNSNFEDRHHFSVSQDVIGSGMLFELQTINLNLAISSVELWKDEATDVFGFALPVVNVEGVSMSNGAGPLDTGSYYFKILGTVAENKQGAYTISASTLVPEAETWAMMLAGLGLVGLQLRRKGKVAKEIAVN